MKSKEVKSMKSQYRNIKTTVPACAVPTKVTITITDKCLERGQVDLNVSFDPPTKVANTTAIQTAMVALKAITDWIAENKK